MILNKKIYKFSSIKLIIEFAVLSPSCSILVFIFSKPSGYNLIVGKN